jgi:tRNA(Ile)-lysidine synthase
MADCVQIFRESLQRFVSEHYDPQRLLVGLSGGLDSVALLAICHSLYPQRTQAIHVNHGYSAQADHWQSHCQSLCRSLQVRLHVRKLTADGQTLQEARARQLRYQVYDELLNAEDLLLLAHHREDQAETVLLHQLQGRGAFGMPQSRQLGAGWLLRPLLSTSRQTLQNFVQDQGLSWMDDPSNLDTRHDRNYLRHEILPLLAQRFPDLSTRLARSAAHVQALEALVVDSQQLDCRQLPMSRLRSRPVAAQLALIRTWLVNLGLPQPSTPALENFLTQLNKPQDRQPVLSLPYGSLRRFRQRIYFVPEITVVHEPHKLTGPGHLQLPQGTLEVACRAGGWCAGALTVCFWHTRSAPESQPRHLLVGGRHRRISELLRAAALPPWRREGYPLICDEQGVLVVPGIAQRDDAQELLAGIQFQWRSCAPD